MIILVIVVNNNTTANDDANENASFDWNHRDNANAIDADNDRKKHIMSTILKIGRDKLNTRISKETSSNLKRRQVENNKHVVQTWKTTNIWVFPKIGVPLNQPFLIIFSNINQPFLGFPILRTPDLRYLNTPFPHPSSLRRSHVQVWVPGVRDIKHKSLDWKMLEVFLRLDHTVE